MSVAVAPHPSVLHVGHCALAQAAAAEGHSALAQAAAEGPVVVVQPLRVQKGEHHPLEGGLRGLSW